MTLLIDGYNLLYAIGVVGPDRGPRGLERSRRALLKFLLSAVEPAEIPRTTVVFDAAEAPPGLPRTTTYHGIQVRFAPAGQDADEVLEELIRADSSPRRLTVVSSDHRIQKAARRRKATALDSDAWYARQIEILRHRRREVREPPDRPAPGLLQEDVDYWLRTFGGIDDLDQDLNDPFPPGYGDDLLPPQ